MTRTSKFRQVNIGHAAIGANAPGLSVVGRLSVGGANFKSVAIEDLTIGRLRVRELIVTRSLITPVLPPG